MHSVRGSNVLITGAAMGLGKLFAVNAVKEGAATVFLWDANENALRQTAEELEAAGGTISYEVVDVTSQDRVAAAAQRVRLEVGAIHVLFNNAGIVRETATSGRTTRRISCRPWRSTPSDPCWWRVSSCRG